MGSRAAMQFLSSITKCWLSVEHISALSSPFLLAHRLVANDVLAQHVLHLLAVAPMLRVAVLQPKNARGYIRRHVLDVGRIHRLCPTSRHEDLDGFEVIADGTLVERALDGNQPSARSKKAAMDSG
jgi:hypothetical protein